MTLTSYCISLIIFYEGWDSPSAWRTSSSSQFRMRQRSSTPSRQLQPLITSTADVQEARKKIANHKKGGSRWSAEDRRHKHRVLLSWLEEGIIFVSWGPSGEPKRCYSLVSPNLWVIPTSIKVNWRMRRLLETPAPPIRAANSYQTGSQLSNPKSMA